jgi:aspartate aminotransferase-like enzyme
MQVPEFVRAAGERPLFSHRSPQMIELLRRLEAGIRPLFGTEAADVLFLAASGSGAMESAVCNLTSPGEEVIVVAGGFFAERWALIAEAYGLTVRVVHVDWRTGASLADVQKAVEQWPAAETVFITWSESSTGVLIEIEAIGRFIRRLNKVLVVDAVSGLGVSPMAMDAWNVDVTVVGSQKGLMLPPGLGIVAIGQRAWAKSTQSKTPRFYWDWTKYRGDVPFTAALSLWLQLDGALDYIQTQGLHRIFARRAQVAEQVRELVLASGMEIFAEKPGNGITGVIPPAGFDIDGLMHRLERDFGIQIAGGLGRLKGQIFRIGHVGHLTDEEVDYFVQSFKRCMT